MGKDVKVHYHSPLPKIKNKSDKIVRVTNLHHSYMKYDQYGRHDWALSIILYIGFTNEATTQGRIKGLHTNHQVSSRQITKTHAYCEQKENKLFFLGKTNVINHIQAKYPKVCNHTQLVYITVNMIRLDLVSDEQAILQLLAYISVCAVSITSLLLLIHYLNEIIISNVDSLMNWNKCATKPCGTGTLLHAYFSLCSTVYHEYRLVHKTAKTRTVREYSTILTCPIGVIN